MIALHHATLTLPRTVRVPEHPLPASRPPARTRRRRRTVARAFLVAAGLLRPRQTGIPPVYGQGNSSRSVVALCAALVLLLQAFVSGLSASAMAATPMVDAFGNVLCVTGADGSSPASDHGKLQDCCTFGCSSSSQLFGTPPSQPGWRTERSQLAVSRPGIAELVSIAQPDFDPARPRAPPAGC